ncbi:hypothetical protein ACQ4LE_006894 [Meloidogyne hapla]
MSTLNQELLDNEKLKARYGTTFLPPLFQTNLEPALIDRIRPFLRAFFSDLYIQDEIVEDFVLAVKEYKDLQLDDIIFNSPAREAFPGRKNKLRSLCKLAIKKFEQFQMDPSDIIYKNLCLSMENEDEYFFSIFPLNFKQFSSPSIEQINYIVISQNVQNISKGTTGLCCWQASFALADFLFLSFSTNLLPYLSNAKYILELGAGCGLVGISLAKQFYLNKKIKLILSDSDNFVLEKLNKNIKLNFGENKDNLIESKYLDWTNFVPNELLPADVITASDIIYDPEIFPSLINLLEYLLSNNQSFFNSPIAIIACTVRDSETLNLFLKLIASRKIQIIRSWELRGISSKYFKEFKENFPKINSFVNLKDFSETNFEPLFSPYLPLNYGYSQSSDFEKIVIFEFCLKK